MHTSNKREGVGKRKKVSCKILNAGESWALAALLEDPAPIPSTSMAANNHLWFRFQGIQCPLLASTMHQAYTYQTERHEGKTPTNIKRGGNDKNTKDNIRFSLKNNIFYIMMILWGEQGSLYKIQPGLILVDSSHILGSNVFPWPITEVCRCLFSQALPACCWQFFWVSVVSMRYLVPESLSNSCPQFSWLPLN